MAVTGQDPRFQEEKFIEARGIFPNHSVKFVVNKTRARAYAAVHNLSITWAQAKDTPSHSTLQGRTDVKGEKEAL